MTDPNLQGDARADCVFCEIVRDESRRFVAEWDDAVAFEPLNLVTPGHLLVIPRQHVEHARDDSVVAGNVMEHAADLADGPCNFITSAGAEACSLRSGRIAAWMSPRDR